MKFPLSEKRKLSLGCSVCFSPVEGDPMTIALRASVLTLLAVTAVVLVSFAKFFLSIRKREKLLLKSK